MEPPGGADVPHPERQRNLLGEAVQEGVEGFEGAVVDDHPQTVELSVSTLIKTHSLGQDVLFDPRLSVVEDPLIGRTWRVHCHVYLAEKKPKTTVFSFRHNSAIMLKTAE